MPSVFWELGSVFLVAFLLPILPFFPVRLAFLIPFVATNVPFVIVAVVAASGAALGTLPLYGVTRKAVRTRTVQRWLRVRWMQSLLRHLEGKMFLSILAFALLPLPDQLMSIAGGLERYPIRKFFLGFFLGRLPYFLLLGYLGSTYRETLHHAWTSLIWVLGI